jgi:hypothetical protein
VYTLVEPQLDEMGNGDWGPQQASGSSVRATPIADAVMEGHSHHSLPAVFSATAGTRWHAECTVFLGGWTVRHPGIALRVATGCTPHAMQPVPFEQVFAAALAPFRDVHFDETVRTGGASGRRREEQPRRAGLANLFLRAEVADDVAIRDLLEARARELLVLNGGQQGQVAGVPAVGEVGRFEGIVVLHVGHDLTLGVSAVELPAIVRQLNRGGERPGSDAAA